MKFTEFLDSILDSYNLEEFSEFKDFEINDIVKCLESDSRFKDVKNVLNLSASFNYKENFFALAGNGIVINYSALEREQNRRVSKISDLI